MTYQELLDRKNNYIGLNEEYQDQIALGYSELNKAIKKNIAEGHPITFVSDFDTDGIFSAGIFKKMYPEANYFITNRFEGYGIPNDLDVRENELFVFLDMGSNDLEKLCDIYEKTGQMPFVIDHHEIDKYLFEDGYGRMLNFNGTTIDYMHTLNFSNVKKDKPDYCTTGLAYKIFEEWLKDEDNKDKINEQLVNTVSIYAGIGTIGDSVCINNPYDDNRYIVKKSNEAIQNATMNNIDIALYYYLDEICGLVGDKQYAHIITKDYTHNMVSIINATGRLINDGAKDTFDLLTASNDFYANDPSNFSKLDRFKENNEDKKRYVSDIMNSEHLARAINESDAKGENIFIYVNEEMRQGVTRIVANRVADMIKKPCIVFTKSQTNEDLLIGSGTNYDGYPNFYESVYIDKLSSFGGHPNVVGLSVEKDKIADCVKEWQEIYKDIVPQKVEQEYLTEKINIQQLLALEPFGKDFPAPKMRFEKIELDRTDAISYRNPNPLMRSTKIDGIKWKTFNKGELLQDGKCVTITGSLSVNHFGGKETLEGDIEEIQEELLKEK